MMLPVGQQLPDSHGAHYSLIAIRRRSAWSILYDAAKAFLNYRYREREFYPAGVDEQLPVLIRCPCYPDDDSRIADGLRELLEFEATQVLTLRGARWFPEPLDVLTLPPLETIDQPSDLPKSSGDSDASSFPLDAAEAAARRTAHDAPRPGAPDDPRSLTRRAALAMVRPQGDSLEHWCGQGGEGGVVARVRCALEALELVALLHGQGLLLGGFDPRDFLVDPDGRFYYVGTDRIVRESRMPRLRRFFPPQRFFGPWAAPEAVDAQGWLDVRSDFYSWAALTVWLLAYEPAAASHRADSETHDQAAFDLYATDPARMRDALMQIDRRDPALLARSAETTSSAGVDRWMEALKCCLDPDPQRRPVCVASLDEMLLGPGPVKPDARRGWRKLFGR